MPGQTHHIFEALAKPLVCASGGFRVRGSGGVLGLNPGILNPVSRRLQGFCKRLIQARLPLLTLNAVARGLHSWRSREKRCRAEYRLPPHSKTLPPGRSASRHRSREVRRGTRTAAGAEGFVTPCQPFWSAVASGIPRDTALRRFGEGKELPPGRRASGRRNRHHSPRRHACGKTGRREVLTQVFPAAGR